MCLHSRTGGLASRTLGPAEARLEFSHVHVLVAVHIELLEPHLGAATEFLVFQFPVAVAVGNADSVGGRWRAIALRTDAELLTADRDFELMAQVVPLRLYST